MVASKNPLRTRTIHVVSRVASAGLSAYVIIDYPCLFFSVVYSVTWPD